MNLLNTFLNKVNSITRGINNITRTASNLNSAVRNAGRVKDQIRGKSSFRRTPTNPIRKPLGITQVAQTTSGRNENKRPVRPTRNIGGAPPKP